MRVVTLDTKGTAVGSLPVPVAAVGTFDGLHAGHAVVLDAVRSTAEAANGTSIAVTFDPHPRQVIRPDAAPGILTTLDEKRWRAERLGIDLLAVIRFDDAVRQLSPEAFVRTFLVDGLAVETMVVGYDHAFGKDRRGDLETMRQLGDALGFEVVSVPPTLVDGAPISSTRIRGLIADGNMAGAARLLGGFYPVAGTVVRGDRRGRELGFPTANVAISQSGKVIPPDGVYAAWADGPHMEAPRRAVVNIGYRPTFDGQNRQMEAHLLDYDGDLYGRMLVLEFVSRVRSEQAFKDAKQLKDQIEQDIATSRDILSRETVTQIRR